MLLEHGLHGLHSLQVLRQPRMRLRLRVPLKEALQLVLQRDGGDGRVGETRAPLGLLQEGAG